MEARPAAARKTPTPRATASAPAAEERSVRSWVFRNRHRLEALLGRPSAPPPPRAPRAGEPAAERSGARAPEHAPRVVVLQPVRRR
jgi:hypothetical protein